MLPPDHLEIKCYLYGSATKRNAADYRGSGASISAGISVWGGFGFAKYSFSYPWPRTCAVPTSAPAIPRRSGETVLGDAMTDTRTAAEYCSAAIHLWELAAATTRRPPIMPSRILWSSMKPSRIRARLPRTPPRQASTTMRPVTVPQGCLTPVLPACHCAAEPAMMLRFVLPNASGQPRMICVNAARRTTMVASGR